MELHRLIGLRGISPTESPRVCKLGKGFQWISILIAMWLAWQWHMEIRQEISESGSAIIDWSIWAYFALQWLLFVTITENKFKYIRQNWFILLIVIVGIPVSWELSPKTAEQLEDLRLLLAVGLLVPWVQVCKRYLAQNRLAPTLLTALVIVIFSGLLISGIDPSIHTPWEGIWWSWVTVTTVGYGDVVPTSGIGQVFAVFLILLGIGMFALLTANFSALILQRDVRRVREENENIKKLLKEMQNIKQEEDDILYTVRQESSDIHKLILNIQELKKDEAHILQTVQQESNDIRTIAEQLRAMKDEEDDILRTVQEENQKLTILTQALKDVKAEEDDILNLLRQIDKRIAKLEDKS